MHDEIRKNVPRKMDEISSELESIAMEHSRIKRSIMLAPKINFRDAVRKVWFSESNQYHVEQNVKSKDLKDVPDRKERRSLAAAAEYKTNDDLVKVLTPIKIPIYNNSMGKSTFNNKEDRVRESGKERRSLTTCIEPDMGSRKMLTFDSKVELQGQQRIIERHSSQIKSLSKNVRHLSQSMTKFKDYSTTEQKFQENNDLPYEGSHIYKVIEPSCALNSCEPFNKVSKEGVHVNNMSLKCKSASGKRKPRLRPSQSVKLYLEQSHPFIRNTKGLESINFPRKGFSRYPSIIDVISEEIVEKHRSRRGSIPSFAANDFSSQVNINLCKSEKDMSPVYGNSICESNHSIAVPSNNIDAVFVAENVVNHFDDFIGSFEMAFDMMEPVIYHRTKAEHKAIT